MTTKMVNIPEIGQIKLVKNRMARSLRISLGAEGVIKVTIPQWMPFRVGLEYAISKKDWIFENHEPLQPLQHGMQIGKQHQLYMSQDHTKTKISSRAGSSMLHISYPPTLSWNSTEVQTAAKKLAIRALKKQAEDLLPPRLEMLAEEHGFAYSDVSVRQLKARWGSCNNKKQIVLNIFLLQLPWALIDYVLLHELVHTKALHHGTDFWDIFENVLPGAKQRRKDLKGYSPTLSAIQY